MIAWRCGESCVPRASGHYGTRATRGYGGVCHEAALERCRARQLRRLRPVPAALSHVSRRRAKKGCRRGVGSPRCERLRGRAPPVDDQFVEFMDTCVQCRGCEPACPSGVPYGQLIEGTRHSLADARSHHAVVAAARFPGARPPPAAARRLDDAGGRAAGAAGSEAARARHDCRCVADQRSKPIGQRRVAVHRLRDGRMAAIDPPCDAARGRVDGRECRHRWPRRRLLRRPARPRRAAPRRRPDSPSERWPACRAARRCWSTRPGAARR